MLSVDLALLQWRAPGLAAAFRGPFVEAHTSTMTFPDDDPTAFQLFLKWMSGMLTLEITFENVGTCIRLHALADRWRVTVLDGGLQRALAKAMAVNVDMLSPEAFAVIWAATDEYRDRDKLFAILLARLVARREDEQQPPWLSSMLEDSPAFRTYWLKLQFLVLRDAEEYLVFNGRSSYRPAFIELLADEAVETLLDIESEYAESQRRGKGKATGKK